MKRLFLGVAIASALGLTGCSEDSVNELKEKTEPLIPLSRISFDPANAVVPLPNDLLFSGTTDGTLQIPGEDSGDYTDPQIALGSLDGWSTSSPISIAVDLAMYDQDGDASNGAETQLSLMASSVFQPGAVRVFEAVVGGALSSKDECKAMPSVSACEVGEELIFGVDFVSKASGNTIAIVPLKPLKPGTSYLYATTSLIQDSEGRPVDSSSTYGLLRLDIETLPLETPEQLQLQTLVNSYEKGIAAAHGVDLETISYTGLFTTQSVADVYEITKLQMVTPMSPYAPGLSVPTPHPLGITVAQAAGLTPEDGVAYALASLADVYTAELTVPIYGECSSVNCLDGATPLVNGRWKALGDSPVSVLSALQAGTLSQANYFTQAQANGIEDPVAALSNPALLVGKQWTLDDGETPTDPTKHLTKFNPVPAISTFNGAPVFETMPVLISMPNAERLQAFYESQGGSFSAPMGGWPATIALHGIGGGKEMSLAYAGAYAAKGVATIAIDMPLHGARGFDANGDGIYEVSASSPAYGAVVQPDPMQPNPFANGDILAFINIGSTLSVQANFRQAIMDHLGLRLALTGLAQGLAQAGAPQIFDASKISLQGLSLGGIVGTAVSTYANTGLVDPRSGTELPNAYATVGSSLVAPSGGLAGSFAGSASFGPVLFENITATEAFQALVDEANTSGFEPGSAEYAALVQAVYAEFIPTFAFAVQTAVDAIDPINHGGMLAATGTPVHLVEVVGDGADNLGDQTLPNAVEGFPLSGTEPLIASLGLDCVDATAAGSGVTRFAKGHHSSLVSPSEVPGVTDGFAAAATAEMQGQVSSYAASAAAGSASIVVGDSSLLQTCAN